MYVLAFLVSYLIAVYRNKSECLNYAKITFLDHHLWSLLGSLIGGRLGYVLLYNLDYYLANPTQIFLPVNVSIGGYEALSGLSYHGGVVGILAATIIFCYAKKMDFWHFADTVVVGIPLGYTLGRIGNFINGELYGHVTTLPWGMYFPSDPSLQLRHPSQLYEAFFEGILIFTVLWRLRKTKLFDGFIFCLYVIGYGTARFFIEFVREPDEQLGLTLGCFTRGQMLCLCMILCGIFVMLTRVLKLSRISIER